MTIVRVNRENATRNRQEGLDLPVLECDDKLGHLVVLSWLSDPDGEKFHITHNSEVTLWDMDMEVAHVYHKVRFANEMPRCNFCGEPWCREHIEHYSDCDCVGPMTEGVRFFEYDGVMYYEVE